MKTIDLRSDTVTRPTPAMLEAMYTAEVGDDVFGEDPTVLKLEAYAARMFGVEAALFCPSGTMTNQVAIKLHTRPGDEVICDETAHVYNYEGGGMAFHSGASVRLVKGNLGRFTAADAEALIQPDNPHHPFTRLVVIENTVNRGGGSIWMLQQMLEIKALCRKHQLALHLDGARLFNAIAAGIGDPAFFGSCFDTISLCLSKGLGAPVGSLLLCSQQNRKQALRLRKLFGGGMRQSGFLAAAGLYALQHHTARLADDHRRAAQLGEALAGCAWVEEVLPVGTNIVVFKLKDPALRNRLLHRLEQEQILAVGFGPGAVRMVTHLDVGDEDIERVMEVVGRVRM